MTSNNANPPAPRRHSTAVVIGAGLIGLALGAIAVIAIAGITLKVRVELPPPPYPPGLSSTPPVGYPSAPPAAPSATPSVAPSVVPVPPLPPVPHA